MQLQYALLSGFFAASGSAFGKLSSLETFQESYVIRAIFFLSMLLANAAVWTMFVKALHQLNSSLVATVLSSTSNYMFTALYGYLLFREEITLLWWIGIFFIFIGLVLVVSDNKIEHLQIDSFEKNK